MRKAYMKWDNLYVSSTRQEQSWQWSEGCGNLSPLKQPRPLKLHPSHTPHAQPSRAGCEHEMAGHLFWVHTTSPLCGKEKMRGTAAVMVQRVPKLNEALLPSHWACAVLASSLSSWKDLPVNISQTLELTTYTQSQTLIIDLLLMSQTVICCKLVTITDRAATWVSDGVTTGGCWTRLLHASHWTAL